MAELQMIATKAIRTRDGFNPRRDVDIEGDSLRESIEKHGVITPITVTENADGYYLLAGHRRLAAAMELGIEELPGMIVAVDDDDPEAAIARQRVLALIDNTKRSDLTIVEEAMAAQALRKGGYTTNRSIAEAVSVSEKRVAVYAKIWQLPAVVQSWLHAGELRIGDLDELVKIAQASQRLCEEVGEFGVANHGSVDRWYRQLQVPELVREGYGDDAKVRFRDIDAQNEFAAGESYSPKSLGLGKDRKVTAAFKKLRALDLEPRGYMAPEWHWFVFDEEAVDAARAYGCLIETGPEWSPVYVIADPEWAREYVRTVLVPRVDEIVEGTLAQRAAQKQANRKDSGPKQAEKIRLEAEKRNVDISVIKEELANARQQAYDERMATHSFNLKLGAAVFEKLDAIKPEGAILEATGTLWAGSVGAERRELTSLAMRGIRYVHPAWIEEHQQKNGRVKLTFLDAQHAHAKAEKFLRDGKGGVRFDRAWMLLLLAEYADPRVTSDSQARNGSQWSAHYGWVQKSYDSAIKQLLGKLPDGIRKQATRRKNQRRKVGSHNA